MEKLTLLENLALNNNLSKSEMNVLYYSYSMERTAKEIEEYLGWKAPNVARLLLTMFTKGLLDRRRLEDNKTYLYLTNRSSSLLDIE